MKNNKKKHTFGLTLLKGDGTTALGDQVTPTREAGGTSHFWLVRSQRTQQARGEAILGELTWGALT